METSAKPLMVVNGGYEESEKKMSFSHSSKSSNGGWSAAIFIIFVEMAEQFAFIGLVGNLIIYLTNVLHVPMAMAAKQVNTWLGISAIFPLLGAFIADSFLGRFKTILFSSLLYFLGMVQLTLSVGVVPLEYRKLAFFVGLYLISVGEGGHKPCVQTFAADQFNERTVEERKAKSSFFNWWYLGLVIGSTISVLAVIYVQDNVSWALGFAVLAAVLAVALSLFLVGVKRYRREAPFSSPFTSIAQVLVAAARKWRVDETRFGWRLCYGDDENGSHFEGQPTTPTLARTNQFRFLDKAMIIDDDDAERKTRNRWRLCSLNQVEEGKLVLRLIPIWLSCLMFAVVHAQLHTFYTKQGTTMARTIGPHFQLSPASLQAIVGFTILLAVPFYDRIFVPLARKLSGHPSGITVLQRIGIGLFLSALNMVVSAVVEAKRVGVAREFSLVDDVKSVVPMSIWWLLPQYIICGFSDAFAIVGLQELFYDQMPETMRSLGAAAYISINGVGNFMSSAIISALQAISSRRGEKWLGDNLNRAHLDYFYWVLAGLSCLNLCVYAWICSRFVYKRVEGDDEISRENVGNLDLRKEYYDLRSFQVYRCNFQIYLSSNFYFQPFFDLFP